MKVENNSIFDGPYFCGSFFLEILKDRVDKYLLKYCLYKLIMFMKRWTI